MAEKTTISGVLNIDKPAGLTSHDVVAKVRRLLTTNYKLPTLKVGHTGTLDPFATGVLLVVLGPATRLIQFSHQWDKEYEATFTFGATSDTDDVTGTITPPNLPHQFGEQALSGEEKNTPPDKGEIEGVLKKFIGTIPQVPPAYSAVKVKGKKLYELARAGLPAEALAKAGETRPRNVHIHEINVTRYEYPELDVRIRCGTGTYIRSLARDLGEQLGVGAYVSSLRRTRIGPYTIADSVPLQQLSTAFQQAVHTPAALVNHLPKLPLTSHNIELLRQGQRIEATDDTLTAPGPVAVFAADHTLVGVGIYDPATSLLSPSINL